MRSKSSSDAVLVGFRFHFSSNSSFAWSRNSLTLSAASTFLFADVALFPIFPASDIAPVTASSATLFVTDDDADDDDKLNDDDNDGDADDSSDNFFKVFGAVDKVGFCFCCGDDKDDVEGIEVVIEDKEILSEDVNKFKSELL